MPHIDISLLGYIITTLSFIALIVYAFNRKRDLYITTQNSPVFFYVVILISLLFALLNLLHLIELFFGDPGSFSLPPGIDTIAQFSGILGQSVLILMLFASKMVIRPAKRIGRVLAVGAHPDDIEIAAGAALAKMRDAGYLISGIVMTRGEKGGNGDTRPIEARRGAQFLGLDNVQVMDFTDTYLSKDVVNITSAIEEMITKVQPDIIFTHSVHDIHQDHQTVYKATLRAARSSRITILCYESPSATQDFHPTYFIDVGKYVDVKIESIRQHWGQRKKSYTKSGVIRGRLAFRGAQAKVDYAEGFEVARMLSAI